MKAAYLSLLALLFCSLTLHADPRLWDPTGLPVLQSRYLQDAIGVDEGDGHGLLVWTDIRSGVMGIRAQRVTATGSELWTAGGVTVAANPGRQQWPAACRTSDGWVIAWVDFRDTYVGEVYAQKLDNNGQPQWTPGGVLVRDFDAARCRCDEVAWHYSMALTSDAQGGAMIAWRDPGSGAEIFVARLGADGTQPWGDPLSVCTGSYWQWHIPATADAAGNMILVFAQEAGNPGLFASKISTSGQHLWGTTGVLVDTLSANLYQTTVCADGADGIYVGWSAWRDGSSVDLRLQRLNAAGVTQFADSGLALCNAPQEQNALVLRPSRTGNTVDGCLAIWEDCRVNGSIKEVYAQKISAAGVMQWTANGFKISGDAINDPPSPGGTRREAPKLESDGQGGLVCVWEDGRNGEIDWTTDLYAERVLADGTRLWSTAAAGGIVAGGSYNQFGAQLFFSSGVSLSVGFTDNNSGSLYFRLQTLDLQTGARLLTPDAVTVGGGTDSYPMEPCVVAMSAERSAVVWEDSRQGGVGLYYQIYGAAPTPLMPATGASLAPDNEGFTRLSQQSVALTADGSGGFFACFEDQRTSFQRLRLQRVAADGDLFCTEAARVVFSDSTATDQEQASLVPDGEGGCYVSWSNYDHNYLPKALVMRFGPDCLPATGWTQPLRFDVGEQVWNPARGLAVVEGGVLAIWQLGTWGHYDIGGALIHADGSVVWQDTICNAAYSQTDPVVVADGSGGAYVVWDDQRSPTLSHDIYAQHLNSQGEALWAANGLAVCADTLYQYQPTVAVDAAHNLCVVWCDFRNASNMDLYGQKFSPAGERLWDAGGRPLAVAPGEQSSPVLASDGADGWIIAWNDGRAMDTDYYQRWIYGLQLTAAGEPAADPFWVANGSALADNAHPQRDVSLATAGGDAVLAWFQDPSDDPDNGRRDIFAQRLHLVTLGAPHAPAVLPGKFALHAAYPNPFNPTTTIGFDLPVTATVKLVVFDLLGREVAVLENGRLAAGSYRHVYDASALASGVYFYRLEAGAFSQTQKLVLLK